METPLPTLIRPDELAEWLGVCRSTIWKWTRKGKLPRPIRISDKITAWKREDIEQWLADRPAA